MTFEYVLYNLFLLCLVTAYIIHIFENVFFFSQKQYLLHCINHSVDLIDFFKLTSSLFLKIYSVWYTFGLLHCCDKHSKDEDASLKESLKRKTNDNLEILKIYFKCFDFPKLIFLLYQLSIKFKGTQNLMKNNLWLSTYYYNSSVEYFNFILINNTKEFAIFPYI